MNRTPKQKIFVTIAAMMLAVSASLAGLPQWTVQGVIDWSPYQYGNAKPINRVYEGRWHLASGNLRDHTACDGMIFTPRAEDIDADVPFGIITGAAALQLVNPIDPDNIDWYEIWMWIDVNNNGEADANDLIDDQEQNWTRLLYQDGAPSDKYYTDSGKADIGDLIKSSKNLKAGNSYLLLIRVYGHIAADANGRYDADQGSSLQFTSPVSVHDEEDQIEVDYTKETAKLPQEGWSATNAPDKYLSCKGNDAGVDDFEVLWIRVNNPPALPVVP